MTTETKNDTRSLRADSLMLGMVVLFATTVLQRVLGLGRGSCSVVTWMTRRLANGRWLWGFSRW